MIGMESGQFGFGGGFVGHQEVRVSGSHLRAGGLATSSKALEESIHGFVVWPAHLPTAGVVRGATAGVRVWPE